MAPSGNAASVLVATETAIPSEPSVSNTNDMPIWVISAYTMTVAANHHRVSCTVLSQLAQKAEITCPFGNIPCFVIVEGCRKHNSFVSHLSALHAAINSQMQKKAAILRFMAAIHDIVIRTRFVSGLNFNRSLQILLFMQTSRNFRFRTLQEYFRS